jgi:endonuclease-8
MTANLPYAVQTSTGIRRDGENAYVHARSGRPCRRCGTTIRVAPIGPPTRERAMFYCPSCQGGLAPGDSGRPIAPLGAL